MPNKLKSASWLGGHFSRINVKEGQRLKKGDIIGTMGNTGHSFGAHLHDTVFLGKLTTIPYQADNPKHRADRALTRRFNDTPGLLLDPSTKKARKPVRTVGWLGYDGHYAEDLITSERGYPLIAWPLDVPGVVGIVRDFGSNRFGKTVVIWFGTDYNPKGKRGKITLKEGVNIRDSKDFVNGKVVGGLKYGQEFTILETKKDKWLMPWHRTSKGWVKGEFVKIL